MFKVLFSNFVAFGEEIADYPCTTFKLDFFEKRALVKTITKFNRTNLEGRGMNEFKTAAILQCTG